MEDNNIYEGPSIDDVGTSEPIGVVAVAVAAVLAAAVYDGVVLVNYGVAVNVAGGLNVAAKVNAVTR